MCVPPLKSRKFRDELIIISSHPLYSIGVIGSLKIFVNPHYSDGLKKNKII
jgi:hypothetical protein